MKLDDRDIIAQPSYEPLSNAELVAHIETYAGLIYDTPLAERGAWQDDIIGPARVLLARINAAETERNTAARRAFNAEAENQRLAAENRQLLARAEAAENERDELRDECSRAEMAAIYFEARVAELEAALGGESARGWRDFTEHPPIGEPIQITTVIDAVREEPDGLYRIGDTSEWQAWRPAPQEAMTP